MGINETIVRHNTIPISVKDLENESFMRQALKAIKEDWVKNRLNILTGIADIPLSDNWKSVLESNNLTSNFLLDCKEFNKNVLIKDEKELISRSENVIFEAGQGLLLDEDHEYFPHVTHSKTGLNNVLELTNRDLEVFYMTRWYTTRHGAGPFKSELNEKSSSLVEDKTNIPNEFQGTLRFGKLDLSLLKQSIKNDIGNNKISKSLVVTCIDQAQNAIPFVQGSVDVDNIIPFISYETNIPVSHISCGPTRETIIKV